MKIIYLHQYFNTPSMSGGSRSYQMAKRLVGWGHEVHMITSSKQMGVKKIELIDGINVHWIPERYSNTMSYSSRLKAFFSFAFKASKECNGLQADIVFATSTPLTIILPAYYISKTLKIPYVFEVRDLWPELPIAIGALKNPIAKWMAKKLEIFAYKNAKHVVALSPGMADGVTAFNPNVTVIPNSSDIHEFSYDEAKEKIFRKKYPELGDFKFGLYAGTFGFINGVSYLVDLALELKEKDSDFKIVAIGQGYEWIKVKEYAQSKGVLGNNLFIYSALPKVDIINAFSAASFGFSLFIDLKEMEANSANKFFDTLAASIPPLINYGGWQQELLKKTNSGLVLDRDVKLAANQIYEILNNDAMYKNMSLNAGKLASMQFDRDNLAAKLDSVLTSSTLER